MSTSIESTAARDEDRGWVSSHIGPSGFRVEIRAGAHFFAADEPFAAGGTDTGPTPYDFLLASLGACTAMTLRLYADRKGWPLEDVRVRLRTTRSYADDCANCEQETVGVTTVERQVELSGALSDAQRQRLLEIADRCPVKQTLARGIRVVPAGTAAPEGGG